MLQHLADLWSYDVSLVEVDAKDTVLKEYVAEAREPLPPPLRKDAARKIPVDMPRRHQMIALAAEFRPNP